MSRMACVANAKTARSRSASTAAFAEVMRACAARAETWINEEIIESYMRLHELGHAHSVETWAANELVGRTLRRRDRRRVFRRIDVPSRDRRLEDRALGFGRASARAAFILLDTQWLTPHLTQFGARKFRARIICISCRRAIDLREKFCLTPNEWRSSFRFPVSWLPNSSSCSGRARSCSGQGIRIVTARAVRLDSSVGRAED